MVLTPEPNVGVQARGNRSWANPEAIFPAAVAPHYAVRVRDLDVRRPELLGVRRTGTVRWWKDEKGYGRITADDGEVLWVHHTEIVGSRSLGEGQRVSFVWKGSVVDHGRHTACDVREEPLPQ